MRTQVRVMRDTDFWKDVVTKSPSAEPQNQFLMPRDYRATIHCSFPEEHSSVNEWQVRIMKRMIRHFPNGRYATV